MPNVQWTFIQCWDEYWRLDKKWFKSKANKHSMKVLDQAMQQLMRDRLRSPTCEI